VQHDWDHGSLQAGRALDRQIDRPRRVRLDPVAEPAEGSVGREQGADAGGQAVEGGVPRGGGLDDRL
jgi:hypothetical protein